MDRLTPAQVEHFLDKGYVRMPHCFDRRVADEWRQLAFERLGYDEQDPQTWTEARVHLPGMNRVEVKEFAPAAYSAICDLMGGEERIALPVNWSDGFIVNFNVRADEPWQAPSAAASGWHKDGDWFRHFLDSPEQGLLTIVIWSDIGPQSGGTFVAPDSIAPVARFLRKRPVGYHPAEVRFGDLIGECTEFEEVTGQVGDVFLLHPYMLHAASNNPSGRPRFITNPPVSLREPMCFCRANGDYSPVEGAVLRALGVESLEFQISTDRERVVPERVARQEKMLAEQNVRLSQS
ncbi:MAG TPA: hypothetical protein DIC52_24790 [Candidatus Latescibacteria bacterium]|nr:hypothetical protein [Candidatus Latescibacterota bacterium]